MTKENIDNIIGATFNNSFLLSDLRYFSYSSRLIRQYRHLVASDYFGQVVKLADLPAACLPVGRAGRHAASGWFNMYYVYVIKSRARNYIYVGLTNNPERRINEHNNGKERTTRGFAPFKTILTEEYPNRVEARKREKYLKSGIGKEYLKSLK